MKIRSITSFFDPRQPDAEQVLGRLSEFSRKASERFSQECAEVQTTRLATTPFPDWLPLDSDQVAAETARALELKSQRHGFSYLGLGPALPQAPQSYRRLLAMIEATENVFFGGVITAAGEAIFLEAAKACAQVVADASRVDPNGFTNLRFSVLANVAPFSPFFPAAYSLGSAPGFALALEAADLAVEAFGKASSLAEARRRLLDSINERCACLERIAAELAGQFAVEFKGIDCSLAPFPEEWCSIGIALQSLGLPALGLHGSTAAAAFLADTLDRGAWKRTGFNGLMLPVLEDSTLAKSAYQTLTLKDLLLFSAVCGTGLDTVPLPGDVTAGQIESLLLDVAALAVRLNKPLTARLMPVPGKSAGQMTSFDFAFFSNGRVMALDAGNLGGMLAGNEVLDIRPRSIRVH